MAYLTDGYHSDTAAYAPVDARVSFIRRTYAHLVVSVLALVGLEALLISSGVGLQLMATLWQTPMAPFLMIALFIGGGFLARWMARSEASTGTKYLGLALYIALQAIFLLPIVYIAQVRFPGITMQAGILTLVVFGGLSGTVLITKKDFSFMGYALALGGWILLGVALLAVVAPMLGIPMFGLGMWYSLAVIALAAGYILYDTSNILHHYQTNEHVAASLELLADVVLLFYHILRLFMLTNNNND